MGNQFAEHITINGVDNAGKITPFLYRGGQPESFDGLIALGIQRVIDLRGEDSDVREWEFNACRTAGIEWVSIPIPSRILFWDVAPTDAQVDQFGNYVISNNKPTFIHCHYGHDRTGAMCAWERVIIQGWSAADAYQEMLDFHFSAFWHPAIKKWAQALSRSHDAKSFKP